MNSLEDNEERLFILQEEWSEQSNRLKETFSELTAQDLRFEKGGEDDLLNKLSHRLYKNRSEVIAIIKDSQSPELKFFRIDPVINYVFKK